MSASRPHRPAPTDRFGRGLLTLVAGVLAALAIAAPAGAQFGPDFRLTGPPFFVSQTARGNGWSVAADDAGNVHLVYFDARNGGLGDVPPFYRRYDRASGVWGPEVRLPDTPTSSTRYVALAVDNDGQVHVVWVDTVAGDQHYLRYKKRDASGAWGPDVTVQSRPIVGWDMRDPAVAADYLGNIYVLWAEGIKDASDIGVCNIVFSIKVGSSWSGAQGLTNYSAGTDPAPGAIAPTVTTQPRLIGAGTIAHVAWADYPAGVVRYRPVRYAAPASPTPLGTGPVTLGAPAAPPTIAARCGEVHVAWADPGPGTIRHRHGEMNASLNELTTFEPESPTGLIGQAPSLAVDGLCNAQLVMVSGGAVVHSRRSWTAGTWSAPVPVSDPASVPADPTIAADTRGSVHVVWTDSRSSPPGSGGAYYDVGGCVALPEPGIAPTLVASPGAPALDAPLLAAKAGAAAGERLPVLIRLRERSDLGALRRDVTGLAPAERKRRVVETLRAAAGRTQAGLLAELISAQRDGRAGGIHPLWSVNAVAAEVSPAEVDRLAVRDDIEAILHDPPRPMLAADEQVPPAPDQERVGETPQTRAARMAERVEDERRLRQDGEAQRSPGASPPAPPEPVSAPRRTNLFGEEEPEPTRTAPPAPTAIVDPLPSMFEEGLNPGGLGARTDVAAASIVVLDQVAAEARACTKCGLCETRANAVPGVGTARSGIVFVGEAPGADEDRLGEPFVGRAGQLLDRIIKAMDDARLIPGVPLDRTTVYICNVLKCRPPENRNPLPHEIESCSPYLRRQLDVLKPRIICCLGKFAAELLVGAKGTIGAMRGKIYRYQGAKLIVTYHPAFCLRNPASKRPVWEDMQLLAREYLSD